MNDDVIGKALLEYFNEDYSCGITVKSSIAEDDTISIPYLFRSKKELPKLEQKALSLCKGKVLDVGAGSGCHSIILQQKGLNVLAIDTSEGAVQVMKNRGLNVQQINFYKAGGKFDTLLFLMNGVGIAETLENLERFLLKAKSLLNKGGQIILDSSDISYMFNEQDGSRRINLNNTYYGDVIYQMEYKNHKTEPFSWLFVDYNKLQELAKTVDFKSEKILDGEHHDYLIRLWF